MLKLANRELLDLAVSKYATMVVGVLDFESHQLRYSIAGHLPAPILLAGDGTPCYLEGEGSPVGLLPEPHYQEQSLALPESFMLMVMSDGVLEVLKDMDLIEKETELLRRMAGPLAVPRELVNRAGWGDIDQRQLEDDIAGLFISRGFA